MVHIALCMALLPFWIQYESHAGRHRPANQGQLFSNPTHGHSPRFWLVSSGYIYTYTVKNKNEYFA